MTALSSIICTDPSAGATMLALLFIGWVVSVAVAGRLGWGLGWDSRSLALRSRRSMPRPPHPAGSAAVEPKRRGGM